MQRNKIKADGTIYAIKEHGWERPGRIVETARLWDQMINRLNSKRSGIKPSDRGVISRSSGSPDTWSSMYTYTGFLAVIGQRHVTPESLAELADLEIPKTGDAVWLDAWKQSLPEDLSVVVVVSKDVVDTWDGYQEVRAVERAARAAESKRREEDNKRHHAIRAQVDEVLAAYGVVRRYGGSPGRVNITIDAEDFMALIERLTNKDDA
jgi:hypothetical protein